MADGERVALVTGAAARDRPRDRARACDGRLSGRDADLRIEDAEQTRSAVANNGDAHWRSKSTSPTPSPSPPRSRASRTRSARSRSPVNNAGWDELRRSSNRRGVLGTHHRHQLPRRPSRDSRVVPGMVERGSGRVVNIGSDAGRVGSSIEAVYSGAKGGVIAFTKTLAREVARTGDGEHRLPGPDATRRCSRPWRPGRGEQLVDALTRAVPMRRLAEPEDVAAAVAFFASDAAGYITGQTLSVSGGLTMA